MKSGYEDILSMRIYNQGLMPKSEICLRYAHINDKMT